MKTMVIIMLMLFAPLAHAEKFWFTYAGGGNEHSISCVGTCATQSVDVSVNAGAGFGLYFNNKIVDIGVVAAIGSYGDGVYPSGEIRIRKRLGRFALIAGIGKERTEVSPSVVLPCNLPNGSCKARDTYDEVFDKKMVGLSFDLKKNRSIGFEYSILDGDVKMNKQYISGVNKKGQPVLSTANSKFDIETKNFRLVFKKKF